MMRKSAWIMILFTWFLGNMSIHFITPALPQLAAFFNVTPRIAQLTISFFLAGKAVSMLLWSQLSEHHGRKPIFILGLLLYTLSNWLCSFSHSALFFLSCRFVQGIAVGATLLMGRAMVNDTHDEQQATRQFAFLFSLAGLFICFLPFIGGRIHQFWPWQTAMLTMAAYGLLLLCFTACIDETHTTPPDALTLRQTIKLVFHNALFVRYLLVSAFMMAGESAFNTSASFILIQGGGFSVSQYGSIKTLMAIMHLLGTGACGWLIRYFSSAQLVVLGVRFFAASAFLMVLFSWTDASLVFLFILPMMVYYFGTGFIVASSTAASVRPFPRHMATALALTLFCQFACSALFSLISSLLSIERVVPFMCLMSLIGICSLMTGSGLSLDKSPSQQGDSRGRIV
ncbi:MFS transporter [Legionella taurinensis]|nr:MFS transporter [Legionella taurinensis]MDX1837776.1 MFS transporter [Legionella taurinensis]